MATVSQNKDSQSTMNVLGNPEQQMNQQGPQQQTEAPKLGAESAIGGAAGNAPTQKAQSSLFANVNQYLDANKNTSGKPNQNLQNKIASVAGNVGKSINEKLTQYKTDLDKTGQSIQETVPLAENIYSQINLGQSVDPNQLSRYKNVMRGQTDTGEKLTDVELGKIAEIQKMQQPMFQTLNDVGSSGGAFKLLKGYFDTLGGNKYTEGQKQLDMAFLKRNPNMLSGAKSKIQEYIDQSNQAFDRARHDVEDFGEMTKTVQKQMEEGRQKAQGVVQNQILAQADPYIQQANALKNYDLDKVNFGSEMSRMLNLDRPITSLQLPITNLAEEKDYLNWRLGQDTAFSNDTTWTHAINNLADLAYRGKFKLPGINESSEQYLSYDVDPMELYKTAVTTPEQLQKLQQFADLIDQKQSYVQNETNLGDVSQLQPEITTNPDGTNRLKFLGYDISPDFAKPQTEVWRQINEGIYNSPQNLGGGGLDPYRKRAVQDFMDKYLK